MSAVPQYALFGSLVAATAGALLLAIVTLTHGLRRRATADTARLRLADTAAVLCFSVAAALGVIGLMHRPHAPSVLAATDDGALVERLQALEARLASAELELQARAGGSASEWRTWDERLTQLEGRLSAAQQRATKASRVDPTHATVAPRVEPPRATPASEQPRSAPPALPVSAPSPPPALVAAPVPAPEPAVSPDAAASPASPVVSAPIVAPPPPPREAVQARPEPPVRPKPPARVEPPVEDPSLGAKLRRDWDEIKRHARDDWREAWGQMKRLFSD